MKIKNKYNNKLKFIIIKIKLINNMDLNSNTEE